MSISRVPGIRHLHGVETEMLITFLVPSPPDISAFGVRSLSAYLRSLGHETRIIFLPGSIGRLNKSGAFAYRYSPAVIDELIELSRGSDLIGVSFMTNYFDRAMQVTEAIKKALKIPVVWGGIHPSCKPEEALGYADMVCIGEGEETLRELCEKMNSGGGYYETPGLWFRKSGNIVRNPLRPLLRDLDSIPHFDFSNNNHFILSKDQKHIMRLNDDILGETLPLLPFFGSTLKRAYRTMTDRGCPHRCSYCNVSNLKAMYKGDSSPYLRARGIANVIDELVSVKRRFPFIEVIQFFDDTFFARPLKQLEEFAALYKEKVSLPFYCQASPSTLTGEKLSCLIDAGLVYVEMGIQTGSKRIRDMYHRTESNEKILEVTRLLHRHSAQLLPPDYHIIIDNPWETAGDLLETARLLFQVPKPYGLCISSLVFFPGTELYNKAVSEGLIENETRDIYRKPFYLPPKKTYQDFLIYLLTFQHFPRLILSAMMSDRAVRSFSRLRLSLLYGMSYALGEGIRLGLKGLRAVLRGDWKRIVDYLKKLLIRDPVVAGRKN